MAEVCEWSTLLVKQLGQMHAAGWAVLVLGVAQVLLASANNIWLYPVVLAGNSLAAFSSYDARLCQRLYVD